MATPAITCPQCAHLVPGGAQLCPQCGYRFASVPDEAEHAQPQAPGEAAPPPVADVSLIPIPDRQASNQQTPPSLPVNEPTAAPHLSAAPAVTATSVTISDQETTRTLAVSPAPPPQPEPAVTVRREIASASKRSRRRGSSPFLRVTRLALACVVVLAIVGAGALGADRYLPLLTRLANLPQATATRVPVGTILFQDPLTTKAHDWPNDEHCAFASDGYHVRDGYECYAPTAQQRDITVSVQARQVSGPTDHHYGLGLRLTAAGDEYLFAIDSSGHWLFGKYVAGAFTAIIQPTSNAAIKQGINTANTLTVRAIGSHFEFAVNGVAVGSADDATLAAGYCGVEGSSGIEVIFTSLKIVKAA